MKMSDDETDLEDFFAAARAEPPEISDTLMARILADADAQMPPARREPLGAALWAMLGGGFGAGGLVTAAALGVWLGLAPPGALPDLAGQLLTDTAAEGETFEAEPLLLPASFGWDQEES